MPKVSEIQSFRFRIFNLLFLFVVLVIISRLFQIQVLNSSRYRAQAYEQQWQGHTLAAKRGDIYTSDGFPVAIDIIEYTLLVKTDVLASSDESTKKIAEVCNMDLSYLRQMLSTQARWIKICSGLNQSQKDDLTNVISSGIDFEEIYARSYPELNMMSHVLGFVGKDKNAEDIGYFGLEQYYNGDLLGQNGWLFQEKTASGEPIIWGGVERIDPTNGSSLYTTIDRSVQFMVETRLAEAVERHAAKSGTVIVVDPSTGAIIAMANYPNFNPKEYREVVKDETLLRNDAISSTYEPGSVIKALTVAAGIDAGRVSPESVYNDTGPRVFSGHKVDNWDGKHHGEETVIEILQHSNNLGAAWVGQLVGGANLMEYFRSFGLGSQLQIDLEGEERGVLYNTDNLKDIELVNASFGQGISATPLQVTMSFAAIANDGILMKPYVISKIQSAQGDIITKPSALGRPISSKTAETMVDILTQAVSGGEAKFFVSKKYKIAGKTGTAQVPVAGGYAPDRTNATFVGFFPSYKNFVMLVKLEEPKDPSGYAAETAVPVWMSLAEKLAGYYGLAPDKEQN